MSFKRGNVIVSILVAQLCLCLKTETSSNSVTSNPLHLLWRHLTSCEIIYVQDITNSKLAQKYHPFSIPPPFVRFSVTLSSFSHQVFYMSHRKYGQCLVLFTVLFEGTKYLKKFDSIFAQKFLAPTAKDEDYYIFATPEEHIASVLNSTVGRSLKYRLVLPLRDHDDNYSSYEAYTMCFYCDFGGQPKLFQLDLRRTFSVEDVFPDFTLNGNGHVMKTTSPVKYKFTTEIEKVENGWELTRGVSKYIMDTVLPHYNFTFIVFSSPNGDTGAPDKNGTWNGCIGQLLNGEAELSLTTSASHARFSQIGFSSAAFYAWVSFSTGRPKRVYSWKAVFDAFQMKLWLALLATMFVLITTFHIFGKFEYALYGIHYSLYKNINLISSILGSVLGIHVPHPGATFSRMLLGVWLLLAFVFNSFYNSEITARLAIPVYYYPPTTFDELVNAKNFKFGMDIAGGSLYRLFETSSSPAFRQIFERLEKPKESIDCIEASMHTNFACITWIGVSDYISWKNFTILGGLTPVLKARDVTNFVPCGLAMARNAIFKPNFDKAVNMIYDSGLGDRWILMDLRMLQVNYKMWKRSTGQAIVMDESLENDSDNLKMKNIVGIIYISLVGYACAIVAFILEFFRYKSQATKSNDKSNPKLREQ